jgi:vacuolar iron transporter family protein
MAHEEIHRTHRTGWLRAAVLGANDGIVSTASLIIGVAAAGTSQENILIAGTAGLVAGAMSMAAGEYVSVGSQADTESADLEIERRSLKENFRAEQQELADIYQERGLTPDLAAQVAEQLMEHDALGAHARDDIGISEVVSARPIQAALYSAATFTIGASAPLSVAWLIPGDLQIVAIAVSSLLFLATLGAVAARTGGAPIVKGAARVTFWSALAMAATYAVGHLFGVGMM